MSIHRKTQGRGPTRKAYHVLEPTPKYPHSDCVCLSYRCFTFWLRWDSRWGWCGGGHSGVGGGSATAVVAEASKGIAAVARDTSVPVIFGVLTTDTMQQALERAGIKSNLGWSYGLEALEMGSLSRALPSA